MIPGLHPGLLIARSSTIAFFDLPLAIIIDTSGAPGDRPVSLSVTPKDAVPPYRISWSLQIDGYTPVPASGSSTSNGPTIGFASSVYHDGPERQYEQVGLAFADIEDANGGGVTLALPIVVGGSGGGGLG